MKRAECVSFIFSLLSILLIGSAVKCKACYYHELILWTRCEFVSLIMGMHDMSTI